MSDLARANWSSLISCVVGAGAVVLFLVLGDESAMRLPATLLTHRGRLVGADGLAFALE